MLKSALALCIGLLGIAPQITPPFPREDAKQLLDNDRVTVWEASWPKGKSFGMHQNRYDTVVVDLANTSYRVTDDRGVSHVLPVKFGRTSFFGKGTVLTEEGMSQPPRRAIVVEVKDKILPE